MGNFGDKFRNERERRGFSLDDVSNVTKISPRMLQAIEEENFDQLPGGVFNKGFIRAYARHLGFNDAEAVTDYLAALREAQISAQAMWDPGHGPGIHTSRTTPEPVLRPVQRPIAEPEPPAPVKPAPIVAAPPASVPIPPAPRVEPRPDLHLPVAEHLASQEGKPVAEPVPGSAASRLTRQKTSGSRNSGSKISRTNFPSAAITGWKTPAISALVLIFVVALWVRHSRSAQGASPAPAVSTPAAVSIPADATIASNSHVSDASTMSGVSSTPVASNPATLEKSVTYPDAASLAKITSHKLQPQPPPEKSKRDKSKVAGEQEKPEKEDRPEVQISKLGKNGIETRIEEKHYGRDVIVRHFQTITPPTNRVPGPFTLVIRANQNCWISASADGQASTHETLIAPAETSLRANREVIVKVGNAAGVTFLLNGNEIPAPSATGVRTFVFNSNGLQTTPPETSAIPAR